MAHETNPPFMALPEWPINEELEFVDPEIRTMFKGKNYTVGTPLQAQLIKTMRELIDEMRKAR